MTTETYVVYEANVNRPQAQEDWTRREYDGDFDTYRQNNSSGQGTAWITEEEWEEIA